MLRREKPQESNPAPSDAAHRQALGELVLPFTAEEPVERCVALGLEWG